MGNVIRERLLGTMAKKIVTIYVVTALKFFKVNTTIFTTNLLPFRICQG